jgi:hypothetical protein
VKILNIFKKYPLSWILSLLTANVLICLTAWRFVDYYKSLDQGENAFFGIYVGISSCILLFILYIRGKKFYLREGRTRQKSFEKKVLAKKTIVLVYKQNLFANICAIVFGIALYLLLLILFPAPQFNSLGFWLARGISIVGFLYGIIFSFLIRKEKMLFKDGKFYIYHSKGSSIITPRDIDNIKTLPRGAKVPRTLIDFALAYVKITLIGGEEIIIKRADRVMMFHSKIKTLLRLFD